MSRYRMIALDIDGTVLNSRGGINPRVQRAVARAEQSGVAVTLATGRTWRGALPVAQALGISDPLVVSNGALVRAPGAHLALDYRPLDRQVAVAAVQLLAKLGFAPLVSTCAAEGPELYYEQAPLWPVSGLFAGRGPQDIRQVYDLAGLASAIDPMKVIALGRTESVSSLAVRLRREFWEQIDVIVTQEAPAVTATNDEDGVALFLERLGFQVA